MSFLRISRESRRTLIAVATSSAGSSTLRLEGAAAGMLYVMNPSTAASVLRVFGSADGESFRALFGADGAESTITLSRMSGTAVISEGGTTATATVYTAASAVYPLPDQAFALRFARIVADADLGTAAQVSVSIKT